MTSKRLKHERETSKTKHDKRDKATIITHTKRQSWSTEEWGFNQEEKQNTYKQHNVKHTEMTNKSTNKKQNISGKYKHWQKQTGTKRRTKDNT